MTTQRGFLSLLLAAGVVAACGTSADTPEETSTGGLTQAEFAQEYCSLAKPCCEGGGLPVAGCAAAVRKFLPLRFDSAAGRACLDSVRASSSTTRFCAEDTVRLFNPACLYLSAEHGTVPVGGACAPSKQAADCAPSADGPVTCGGNSGSPLCTLQLVGDEGASPCTHASARSYACNTSKGLHCDVPVGSPGVCRKAVPLGAACQRYDDDPCVDDAYCENGTCTPRSILGTPCTQGYNTETACPKGSYCDDRTCLAFLPNGAACSATGASGGRCASQFCTKSGACGVGFDSDRDGWVDRICTP